MDWFSLEAMSNTVQRVTNDVNLFLDRKSLEIRYSNDYL